MYVYLCNREIHTFRTCTRYCRWRGCLTWRGWSWSMSLRCSASWHSLILRGACEWSGKEDGSGLSGRHPVRCLGVMPKEGGSDHRARCVSRMQSELAARLLLERRHPRGSRSKPLSAGPTVRCGRSWQRWSCKDKMQRAMPARTTTYPASCCSSQPGAPAVPVGLHRSIRVDTSVHRPE